MAGFGSERSPTAPERRHRSAAFPDEPQPREAHNRLMKAGLLPYGALLVPISINQLMTNPLRPVCPQRSGCYSQAQKWFNLNLT
jgi:hypothetical protein